MCAQVLVFDSGVGGLSILDELRYAQPQWQYHYLFDNAYFPYGELAENVLIERVVSLLSHAYLQLKPQLIVLACNSASTLALPSLRERLPIPLVGVVPAVKTAAQLTRSKHIGLLATPGTVARQYTQQLISEFAPDCKVDLIGSTYMVEQAERKMRGEKVDIDGLAQELTPWQTSPLDTIVLGCTHFPLLREELLTALGKTVSLVDSGQAIARRVNTLLSSSVGHRHKKGPLNSYAYSTADSSPCLLPAFAGYNINVIKPFSY